MRARTLAWLATAGALFVVGVAVGDVRSSPESGMDPATSTDVDRMPRPGAALTAPWYEPGGRRALAGSMVLLERRLEEEIAVLRAADPTLRVGVFLRELEDGIWIGVDEGAAFVPASLMKVAVLFHALSRVERDPTLLDREVLHPGAAALPTPDNTSGRPEVERMKAGEAYTYRDLLRRMISYSDNHAKDMILLGVEAVEVETYMASIGFPALVDGGRAVTTPRAYGALFRILYNSTLFSREQSEFALGVLRDATFEPGLRAALDPGVPIASKFGIHFDPTDLEAGVQLHECGIVYDEAPWTVCIMTRSSLKSIDQLAGIVERLARIAAEERQAPLPWAPGIATLPVLRGITVAAGRLLDR